jgi:hypothetical protein
MNLIISLILVGIMETNHNFSKHLSPKLHNIVFFYFINIYITE